MNPSLLRKAALFNRVLLCRRTFHVCACFSLVLIGSRAVAQSSRVPQRLTSLPSLSQKITFKMQRRSLAQCTAELSVLIGRGIVVDDEPQLKQADFDFQGTATEALDKLAETFDYSWTVSKHGAILMRKQFQTAGEYPQLNVPELQQAAQDALAILSHYPANYNTTQYVEQLTMLYHMLTPEQQLILQAGKPILGRQLNAAQFDIVQRLIASTLFDEGPKVWSNFAKRLETPFSTMPQAFFELRPLGSNYREFAPGQTPVLMKRKTLTFECVYTDRTGAQIMIPLVVMPEKKKQEEKK